MSLIQILAGDCRAILPTLEAQSVQTCVTSPPYWGLRNYGTAQWEGGGCALESLHQLSNGVCVICGARRIDAQLGLESTPQEFIANMVRVFREVWRVLRDDGTLWLNMGDSYCAAQGGRQQHANEMPKNAFQTSHNGRERKDVDCASWSNRDLTSKIIPTSASGLKPKDLCMMPARLAMALQADGWYLRSDIIWHKPNPMPESVTDRPTKSHEYIFLLTKSERYFYDAEAIREKTAEDSFRKNPNGRPYDPNHKQEQPGSGNRNNHSWNAAKTEIVDFRNKRSVWTIATQPYAEAHFATFPEEIPKLCILAGSKLGDTVLDPFAGSGTVGKVALELGRKAILIELNPAYIELANERTLVTPGFL
jgi:DNA modification methylase